MADKGDPVSGKERFDALMALADFRLKRKIERSQHEWRLSFAVWALLVSATYSVHPRPPNILILLGLGAVVAFHFLHVTGVRKRNNLDTRMTFFYADRAERMLRLPEGPKPKPRPDFEEAMKVSVKNLRVLFSGALWSSGLEVLITLALAGVAFWLIGSFDHSSATYSFTTRR